MNWLGEALVGGGGGRDARKREGQTTCVPKSTNHTKASAIFLLQDLRIPKENPLYFEKLTHTIRAGL